MLKESHTTEKVKLSIQNNTIIKTFLYTKTPKAMSYKANIQI